MVEASRGWRAWWPLLLLFIAPWVVYVGLLAVQPPDRFDAWHNDVAWPAAHYLTAIEGGLLLPIFGHLMFGGVGALLVALMLILVGQGVCTLLRLPDPSRWIVRIVCVVAPLWSFTIFKAIPETVTEIDAERPGLTVRKFGPLLRWPTETIDVAPGELLALELTTYYFDRNATRYLELFAYTRAGRVRLAQRACAVDEVKTCLGSGDADVIELAGWLGFPGRAVQANETRHLLRTGVTRR